MFDFLDAMKKMSGETLTTRDPSFMENEGPPKPQMGPHAPPEMGPEMPEAYTQNRMKEWGMPKVAQIGEALFDSYRANKWEKQNGPREVDEFDKEIGGKSAQLPHSPQGKDDKTGKGSGVFDGGDFFSRMFKFGGF